MLRSITITVALSALIALVAACSGAPAQTASPGPTGQPTATPVATPTAEPTSPPTPASTPSPAPTPTQAQGGTGSECAGLPTFDPNNPTATPSFLPDTQLEAIFPPTIDGQPVTDVHSGAWIATICYMGGQASVDRLLAGSPAQFGLGRMTIGTAEATIDGESVTITALRFPGQDVNAIVQNIGQLSGAISGEPEQGTLTTATIGGKNVYVWTTTDGDVTYLYVRGDVLIGTSDDDLTDSQLNKLFAALP